MPEYTSDKFPKQFLGQLYLGVPVAGEDDIACEIHIPLPPGEIPTLEQIEELLADLDKTLTSGAIPQFKRLLTVDLEDFNQVLEKTEELKRRCEQHQIIIHPPTERTQ